MYNELTKNDIKKMEEEIEYRKLVVRKEAIEAVKERGPRAISARILNITPQSGTRIKMRAGSGIWSG